MLLESISPWMRKSPQPAYHPSCVHLPSRLDDTCPQCILPWTSPCKAFAQVTWDHLPGKDRRQMRNNLTILWKDERAVGEENQDPREWGPLLYKQPIVTGVAGSWTLLSLQASSHRLDPVPKLPFRTGSSESIVWRRPGSQVPPTPTDSKAGLSKDSLEFVFSNCGILKYLPCVQRQLLKNFITNKTMTEHKLTHYLHYI